MEDRIGLHFTDDEYKLIIESLLFASTTDVSANWTESDNNKMLEMAIIIKNLIEIVGQRSLKIDKKRISILKGVRYEDTNRAKQIKKVFKI